MVKALNDLHDRVKEELQTTKLRVQAAYSADRLWNRVLTHGEQSRLGGDLQQAYQQGGSVGMWMRLHGCSQLRAIIDVGRALSFLDDGTHRWLLRETGEFADDPEEALQLALQRADLVVVHFPRAIHWMGTEIPIDWTNRLALWNYFVTVCERAKAGVPVDASDFGENQKPDYHVKQKSRLSKTVGFPLELATKIVAGRAGQQRLEIERQRICILDRISNELLCEG